MGQPIRTDQSLLQLLKRPEFSYSDIAKLPNVAVAEMDPIVAKQVEIQAKYSGYIKRQEEES